jgi:hypothetical protein
VLQNCGYARFFIAISIAYGVRSTSLEHHQKKDARKLLAEIYGWFAEGFDTTDLRESRVPLNELSRRAAADVSGHS